jgi:hypothetical protein
MDVGKLLADSLARVLASGDIEKKMDEALTKAITSIVTGELSSYSNFGKQLEEKVRNALAIHGDVDLPSYNTYILEIIKRRMGYIQGEIEKQIDDQLTQMLAPAPPTIKLSQLIADYLTMIRESREGGCDCNASDRITVLISDTGPTSRGHDVYLDKDAKVAKRDCEIHLGISQGGTVYWLRFKSHDSDSKLFSGPYYGFERSLFQMKAAGTIIEVDCDEDDVETSINPD